MHARKDKLFYAEVKMVDSNPKYYFKQIQEMLVNYSYEVGEYIVETINEAGKERVLMKLPYYPDRIIQWTIVLQIEKHLTRKFTFHTCASLPGRGKDRCIRLTETYLRDVNKSQYCLKIDIHHFYPSIDREILKQKLRRVFKDPKLLWLLDLIYHNIWRTFIYLIWITSSKKLINLIMSSGIWMTLLCFIQVKNDYDSF